MKKATLLFATVVFVLGAQSAAAQAWRGVGRLHGVVLDQAGKPIAGATVTLRSVKAEDGPEAVRTDAKGRWAAGGLINGGWHVDIAADGFLTRKLNANVSEIDRLSQPMKIQLEPLPPPEPPQQTIEERETVQIGGVEVSPEVVSQIEAANLAMQESKWKEAAAGYEKALEALPDHSSIKFAAARAHYGAGDLKKAIGRLTEVYQADSGNVTAGTLLANMLIEDGRLDDGKKVLDAMPPGAISDPDVLVNVGILFMNKAEPKDAHTYFNRAIAIAPEVASSYYYRALASLQMKEMAAAKKDLTKVIELAPASPEAGEAKDLLAQIK